MVESAARPLDRNGIILFAVPMAITTILAWVGDAFAPTLLVSAPIVLILCNPRLRNLVLAAPTLGAVPFITIAVARLVLTDPFFYWFGRRYGDFTSLNTRVGLGTIVTTRGDFLTQARASRDVEYVGLDRIMGQVAPYSNRTHGRLQSVAEAGRAVEQLKTERDASKGSFRPGRPGHPVTGPLGTGANEPLASLQADMTAMNVWPW